MSSAESKKATEKPSNQNSSNTKPVEATSWAGRITGGIAAAGLITSIVMTSRYVGGSDTWATIQSHVLTTTILSVIGSVFLLIMAYLYFFKNDMNAMIYSLVMISLSVGMSFAALAVASITRT